MKKIPGIFLILSLFLSGCGSSGRPDSELIRALQSRLNNRLSSDLYRDVISGIIISEVNGFVLYSNEPDAVQITASTFKTIPAAAALIFLGADYRFSTPLSTDGEISDHVLEGDLYIKGSGDPSLKRSDFEDAVQVLYDQGIREISGDLVYDTSLFDYEKPRYGNNARNLYSPSGALIVDYGWIEVKMNGADSKPDLRLSPESSYAKLDYDVEFIKSFKPGRPDMTFRSYSWGDHYSIRGKISGWDRQYKYVRLGASRPGLHAAVYLNDLLKKKGILLTGSVRKGDVPEKSRILYAIRGEVLSDIVTKMNQESNNVIAENLNKVLAARFGGDPGTRKKGVEVLEKFCEKELGLPAGEFSVGDASGLSVDNRFSARHFITALNAIYRNKKVRQAFIDSLAPQGHHPHARDPVPPDDLKIRVKTGTLSVRGVNTVVGYILPEDSPYVYSFAVLCNRKVPGPMTYSGTLTNPLLKSIVEAFKEYISE